MWLLRSQLGRDHKSSCAFAVLAPRVWLSELPDLRSPQRYSKNAAAVAADGHLCPGHYNAGCPHDCPGQSAHEGSSIMLGQSFENLDRMSHAKAIIFGPEVHLTKEWPK